MNDALKISVVICSYNREQYIIDAIDSLYNQTLSKEKYEVIVVDNNSIDNTNHFCQNYIQTHPNFNVYYLEEPTQGASFARNTGAAFAKAPLLAFMDDDAIADTNFLARIIFFFESHSEIGGLGGRIIPKYIPAEPEWMSHYVSSLVGNFHYSEGVSKFKPGKYPLESNMVVTKKHFIEVGGFNTLLPGVVGTLRIGGEGKDFFMKLQALNEGIYYDPDIKVQHVVEVNKLTPEYMYRVASGIGRGERVRMLSKSNIAYYKKIAEYIFKLGASFILGIKYSILGSPAKARPVIQFRLDALKGLLGK
jgi:glycosyltransferase involved in cell wall biosynthesis